MICLKDLIKKMDRVTQLQEIHYRSLELFKKKNQDYGDAFAKYGTLGVLVRISDKLQRFHFNLFTQLHWIQIYVKR